MYIYIYILLFCSSLWIYYRYITNREILINLKELLIKHKLYILVSINFLFAPFNSLYEPITIFHGFHFLPEYFAIYFHFLFALCTYFLCHLAIVPSPKFLCTPNEVCEILLIPVRKSFLNQLFLFIYIYIYIGYF